MHEGDADHGHERGEGRRLWIVGDTMTFKATAAQTAGSLTAVEVLAEPEAVEEALERLDLTVSTSRALRALVSRLIGQAGGGPGQVEVTLSVRVEVGALEGALLTATTRFAAADEESRKRLLAHAEDLHPPPPFTLRSSSALASRKPLSFSA